MSDSATINSIVKKIVMSDNKVYYRLTREIGRFNSGQIIKESTLDELIEENFLKLL